MVVCHSCLVGLAFRSSGWRNVGSSMNNWRSSGLSKRLTSNSSFNTRQPGTRCSGHAFGFAYARARICARVEPRR
ncbi:unnamed protein product [Ectocarpus sp. CCAP 1310/34]|nr:unnamed protein product [Ectocarpus sp. CCAP 1310/34]